MRPCSAAHAGVLEIVELWHRRRIKGRLVADFVEEVDA
jgi:hypothetical protein